jgi:hypothetical protein
MNARTLLDNFDLIADAPGGVPKLRELILQMAVRGKLVPQDQQEAPVRLFDGDKTKRGSSTARCFFLTPPGGEFKIWRR